MSRGSKLFLATTLIAGLLAYGCSEDDGDGGTGPGGGHPPAAMVDFWLYQNVTVNGAPASLATILDWDPQAVDARVYIGEIGQYNYEERNATGGQLYSKQGFVFIDGDEMDINIQYENGSDPLDEMTRYAWTLSGDVFTLLETAGTDTILYTLDRDPLAP